MVDPTTPWIGALAVIALLGASAFFSATEIAVFSLPPTSNAGRADRRRRRLADLRANPHRLLVTLLVGNNLVNVALTSVVTIAAASVLPPGEAAIVATAVATTLVLVFGEILPKSYGLGHAEGWALAAARPLAVVGTVLSPLVIVFDFVTRRLGTLVGGSAAIEKPFTD